MADLPHDFGERLLEREEVDSMKMQQLRQQITATLETKLSPRVRWFNAIGGGAMITIVLAMLPMVIYRWADQPFTARSVTIVGLGGLLLMGAVMLAVARRGVYDRRSHNSLYICVAFLMSLGLGVTLLHTGWSSGDGQSVFGGAVLLVFGGGTLFLYILEQYHLATQRKLLELELRLAEMAELLERMQPGR